MRKLIILLLCCGVLISMVACGGNTVSPSTESSSSIALEIIMTEILHVTTVEPTEKEKETVSIESQEQISEPTHTTPTATVKSIEEIKHSVETNTSKDKVAYHVVETVTNTISQYTENETTVIGPTKEITPVQEAQQHEFDIYYWITFAKEYALSVGLTLDSEAVSCWDNPISANSRCIYLERDIISRLDRYAKDEDVTDVWIWAEPIGDDCYNIYIGYA